MSESLHTCIEVCILRIRVVPDGYEHHKIFYDKLKKRIVLQNYMSYDIFISDVGAKLRYSLSVIT